MRLVARGLALALGAALSVPAPAQVPLAPLAPGEMLLKTEGVGQDVRPADRATLSLIVLGRGPDAVAAQRSLEAKMALAAAAVRAAGIDAADIEAGEMTIDRFDMTSFVMAYAMMHSDRDGSRSAYGRLRVTIRDLRAIERVRAAVRAGDLGAVTPPEYYLADAGGAVRLARENALLRARTDADTQAAQLNMRVVRIARISERLGVEGLSAIPNDWATVERLLTASWGMRALMAAPRPEVETFAGIGVDFVLAPR